MRDKLKNITYFDRFIAEDTERVERFQKKLNTNEVRAERILAVKTKIHDLKLGLLIAKYSRGDDVAILKREYLSLLEGWKEVFCKDYYNKSLKMISLAVLFCLEDKQHEIIDEIASNYHGSDWLIDFLVNPQLTSEHEPLMFVQSFARLKDIVYKGSKVELLKLYLDHDWYCEDCGCYEAHNSSQNIYYGYWSFEAGAISKILKLDDALLKDVSYYPYDLVHF